MCTKGIWHFAGFFCSLKEIWLENFCFFRDLWTLGGRESNWLWGWKTVSEIAMSQKVFLRSVSLCAGREQPGTGGCKTPFRPPRIARAFTAPHYYFDGIHSVSKEGHDKRGIFWWFWLFWFFQKSLLVQKLVFFSNFEDQNFYVRRILKSRVSANKNF